MSKGGHQQWTQPETIKIRLKKMWKQGDVLASALVDVGLFPLRLSIRGPSSAEISADFSATRQWIADWRKQAEFNCEWKTFSHRLFGTNEMPVAVLFPDVVSVVCFLGVSTEWIAFAKLVEDTRSAFPQLLPWITQRPVSALELTSDWPRLLAIVGWVQNHPCSGIYLRQIDIPGVHSKFIEAHRGVIAELLDLVLPADVIVADARGSSAFNRRYGFCDKPERIRLRFLDASCAIEPNRIGLDITLSTSAFAKLSPGVTKVFITENETNFLAFPDYPKSLVLFGSGYGWSSLDGADWLHRCEIYYWGDIDSHGFAILDQLRGRLPQAQSFLMDIATLNALRSLCSIESKPVRHPLSRLSAEEESVFEMLRENPRSSLRLEQEHIPFSMVKMALSRALPKLQLPNE